MFLNGYLGASGVRFSSPDHFDVDDVLPSQVPLLEQIADTRCGWDVAFYNTDVSLPRQFWSFTYDALHRPGPARTSSPNVPPVARRPDLLQPHPLAAAEPPEPGPPAGSSA